MGDAANLTQANCLDADPLDLIQGDPVAGMIVQLVVWEASCAAIARVSSSLPPLER